MGEGWVAHKGFMSLFGRGYLVVYACLFPDGTIYDVTEMSVCQGMLSSAAFRQLGPDCCKVWLHFSNPEAGRQRQRHQPPHEAAGGRQRQRHQPPHEAAGGRKNKRQKGRRRR